jgi:hypothetical protein
MKKLQNHGFMADPINEQDFKLGQLKLKAEVLQPDGQWDAFLPVKEYQRKNGLETYACVSYGTLNCIEILMKRLYNE